MGESTNLNTATGTASSNESNIRAESSSSDGKETDFTSIAAPVPLPASLIDWNLKWNESRKLLERLEKDCADDDVTVDVDSGLDNELIGTNRMQGSDFLYHFCQHKMAIHIQLRNCINFGVGAVTGWNDTTTMDGHVGLNETSIVAPCNTFLATAGEVIGATRKALRLALSYLSVAKVPLPIRHAIQTEAFEAWHNDLLQLLSTTTDTAEQSHLCSSQFRTSFVTLQRTAARLLCNTVTNCFQTATQLLLTTLSTAPTTLEIADRIMLSSSSSSAWQPSIGKYDDRATTSTLIRFNWVDLILSHASQRSTLAAIVACLHNSLCAATKMKSDDEKYDLKETANAHRKVASCPLLVSTLLRHVLSALRIVPTVSTALVEMDGNSTEETNPADDDISDEATEWILLTLSQLLNAGFLPNVYKAIHPSNVESAKSSAVLAPIVLPEHIVLLHAVRSIVEQESKVDDVLESDGRDDIVVDDDDATENDHSRNLPTFLFLATLYESFQHTNSPQERGGGSDDETSNDNTHDDVLRASARQLILDILAETMALQRSGIGRIRHFLGIETALLSHIVLNLAAFLDQWHETNKNKLAREQSTLNETDQFYVTSMIRVLGNLCYQCPQNQNCLRLTLVEHYTIIRRQEDLNPASDTKSEPNSEEASTHIPLISSAALLSPPRNGLHVLLSCTSMSYACFTLREWVVVAIRYALENCPANQAVVELLEAMQAVNSAELSDMGIRINLDASSNKMTIDSSDDAKNQL